MGVPGARGAGPQEFAAAASKGMVVRRRRPRLLTANEGKSRRSAAIGTGLGPLASLSDQKHMGLIVPWRLRAPRSPTHQNSPRDCERFHEKWTRRAAPKKTETSGPVRGETHSSLRRAPCGPALHRVCGLTSHSTGILDTCNHLYCNPASLWLPPLEWMA